MEIKKAWERMKKQIKKETGISYGFSMTARQIKNGTATLCLSNTMSYEAEIARAEASDKEVQGFKSWSDEEKRERHEYYLRLIKQLKGRKAKYGTKDEEARQTTERIVNSKAFKEFKEEVGEVTYGIEEANNCYYIRFNY